MQKAMMFKELRETLPIALIAVAVYVYMAVGFAGVNLLTGSRVYSEYIPFVGGGFLSGFSFISVLFAVALGLRQSLWESVFGTYPYLLHHPMSRSRLIAIKLGVGTAVYLVVAAVPILICRFWAATPGTHASPFQWSMTLPAWQAWLSIAAIYLAAFLSGIRPARWYGSRLFPLAMAGLLAVLISLLPWWWICGLAALVLLAVLLITAVLHVARIRDY